MIINQNLEIEEYRSLNASLGAPAMRPTVRNQNTDIQKIENIKEISTPEY